MLNRMCTAFAPPRYLRQRLLSRAALPVFLVGAVLLAAGIYGAWRVQRLHKRGAEMLSDNVASIREAEALEASAREIQYLLKRHRSSGEDRHLDGVDNLASRAALSLSRADVLAKTERERRLVAKMSDALRRFREDFARLQDGDEAAGRDALVAELGQNLIANEMLPHIGSYIALNEQQLEHSRQRNASTANRLMFGLLLLGACGGVTGLLAGYGIARVMHRRIVQLAIPIRDAAGTLSQVAGPVTVDAEPGFDELEAILRDVSHHVTTVVERLQESERDRLRAEQLAAVGQLATGLAHELRNPLTALKAILQLAADPGDLSNRDLDVLREETERLEQSVQSLLDFARPPQPRLAPTDLGKLLQETVQFVKRRAERQGIMVSYAPPRPEVTLLADAAQLRQVALNLLLNAIDVTPRGGAIRIDCRVERAPTPKDRLGQGRGRKARRTGPAGAVIRVSDTGPGLPPDLNGRLFDPFVTTKETGTGLGLSICKRIVELHGGAVAARDQREGGAVFEVQLPLRPNRSGPSPPHGSTARDAPLAKGGELVGCRS